MTEMPPKGQRSMKPRASTPLDAGAQVFRAPMRSRDDAVPAGAAVGRALALGICGVGGRVDGAPTSIEEALSAVDARHGERFARRVERFAAAPDGAYVWTQDIDGMLWLGRLAGPWRYDASSAAAAVDLVHVRPCRWLAHPVSRGEAPAGVLASFARGGRNWQGFGAAEVAPSTAAVWATHRGVEIDGAQPAE